MKILVMGAGVIGCNLVHNLHQAGKKVTLLARGTWMETLRTDGLVIRNRFSFRKSCDRISVVSDLLQEDFYDVIFVCLRYTQLSDVLEKLRNNESSYIVFIGNNMDAEGIAKALPEKHVMFGFVSSAGHREKDCVVSVDLKKVTIGVLRGDAPHDRLCSQIFAGTKYQVNYETNMGDYLKSHAAFVLPAAFACYYAKGNLKKIRKDKALIEKIIAANAECYEALEKLGYELLPKGEEDYQSAKYRKMCYRFYRLMCSTFLGKLCVSDHALGAVDEMDLLAAELEKLVQRSGVEAKNFHELKQYMLPYLERGNEDGIL